MLKSLAIERFRGISSLILDDLRRINIFIGGNGSGKTSVLEAFNIAANPLAPSILAQLSQWREMAGPNLHNVDALKSYFLDLQILNAPRLRFNVDGEEYILDIQPISASQITQTIHNDIATSEMGSGEIATEFRGILCRFQVPKRNNTRPLEARLHLMDQGFQAPPHDQYRRMGSFFIHARRATSLGETARLLTTLYEQKRESEIIETLQQIDGRLKRLWPGVRQNSPVVLADVGLPVMLPINVLGDGFCRVALMITGLLFGNPKLLIVDEVDSGLHHTVMEKFWASMLSLGHDKQVFCSTHDEEMLEATLPAFKKHQDALAIYRIDRKDDGTVRAERYDYETFELATRAQLEVR
ncbi:MAG: AAA family ATPase [Phycisphaerales bacterium]|nr:AAA family ATPase [Phycisphaerales bacterium]